jgi:carotenoid cleavage dioxygenase
VRVTSLDDPTTTANQDDRPPFYMRGNYAPVPDEIEAFDLPVEGALPTELSGRFLRNGANPKHGTPMHWFDGDGMLHGIRIRDGKAEWYRNRWIDTKLLAGAERINPDTGQFDLEAGRANTHVIGHAGKIFALEEASLPNEISPDLDTLGPYDFDGKLTTPFTAHPHVCPETGEMHFFGYGNISTPHVTYHRADANGQLVIDRPLEVPALTMMHDFALTANYVVFMDLPIVFNLDAAVSGVMPYRWDDSYGARLGVLRRDDPHGEVR